MQDFLRSQETTNLAPVAQTATLLTTVLNSCQLPESTTDPHLLTSAVALLCLIASTSDTHAALVGPGIGEGLASALALTVTLAPEEAAELADYGLLSALYLTRVPALTSPLLQARMPRAVADSVIADPATRGASGCAAMLRLIGRSIAAEGEESSDLQAAVDAAVETAAAVGLWEVDASSLLLGDVDQVDAGDGSRTQTTGQVDPEADQAAEQARRQQQGQLREVRETWRRLLQMASSSPVYSAGGERRHAATSALAQLLVPLASLEDKELESSVLAALFRGAGIETMLVESLAPSTQGAASSPAEADADLHPPTPPTTATQPPPSVPHTADAHPSAASADASTGGAAIAAPHEWRVEVRQSALEGAGEGLFVTEGVVPAGTLVCLYAGEVWGPEDAPQWSVLP